MPLFVSGVSAFLLTLATGAGCGGARVARERLQNESLEVCAAHAVRRRTGIA
jgi:hypothetical protein